jgi:hypothetical protein
LKIEYNQVRYIFDAVDLDVLNVESHILDSKHVFDLFAGRLLAVDVPGVGEDGEIFLFHEFMLSLF